MQIGFELDNGNEKITPLSTAQALVECERFSITELKEIIAYLSVYTRYNK